MNERQMFIDILKIMEKRSTCKRVQVAALIVRDGRIISTGWNGVPSGIPHCNEIYKDADINDPVWKEHHGLWSKINEIHSEVNALSTAARNGVCTDAASIYCSVSPCSDCSKMIIASGIRRVYYLRLYDRETNGLDLMKRCGISIINLLGEKDEWQSRDLHRINRIGTGQTQNS